MAPSEAWDWTRSILSLLGPAIGLPSLIALLLGRHNANKKLDLDEKGSEVSEFQALNQVSASIVAQARQAMADAQAAATAARNEASGYRAEREEFRNEVDNLIDIVRKLRDLVKTYVTRTGMPMTSDEQAVFDQTIDPRSLPGRRRKR